MFLSTRLQLDFSNTGLLDHGPRLSRAHDTSMEPLARPTDLCQAAVPAAAAPTERQGSREVYPSPMTHIFPPARLRFSSLHQQDGEANDENLPDRSSFRLDSPPAASRVT